MTTGVPLGLAIVDGPLGRLECDPGMVITGFQVYEPTGPCTNFPNPCDCDEQRVSPKSSTPEGVMYYDAEAGEFKKKAAAAAKGGEVEERAIVFEQIPEFLFPLFASLSGAGLKIHCEAPMQKSWGGGGGHPQD